MIESTHQKSEDGEDSTLINCSGILNIETASELKNSLQEALNQNGDIILDVENVERIDTSCIQTICSLFKSAVLTHKKITWKNVPDTFSETAKLLAVDELIALS